MGRMKIVETRSKRNVRFVRREPRGRGDQNGIFHLPNTRMCRIVKKTKFEKKIRKTLWDTLYTRVRYRTQYVIIQPDTTGALKSSDRKTSRILRARNH